MPYFCATLMRHDSIIIVDFGSQYTQLIARRVRELNIYSEIIPFNRVSDIPTDVKGIILSGGPKSVNDPDAPDIDFSKLPEVPVLGICYGAQLIALRWGGNVAGSEHREYGRSELEVTLPGALFKNVPDQSVVWMSHGDTITHLPEIAEVIAKTPTIPVAAYELNDLGRTYYALQFHPEVYHSEHGLSIIRNFCVTICGCSPDWTPAHFITETVERIKEQVSGGKVVLGLSGGVDSSVAAVLLNKAIGDQLFCIFVNNGLLRLNEYHEVLESYKGMGLNVKGVDASQTFLFELNGVKDPETKRKIIGKEFVDVFVREAESLKEVDFLGQGTIYPDVIESAGVDGPANTIKSHHNVGGLPDYLNLNLVEPLKMLFKDEVRRVGLELGISQHLIGRHPFPGPGLAIRIIGEITAERVQILQKADAIFIEELRKNNLYDAIWQAGAIYLPIRSVGVMGDERTYENVICLRAVTSVDGMTADWADIPNSVLKTVSNRIINNVKGINRVVYDISSKPPATIEWE